MCCIYAGQKNTCVCACVRGYIWETRHCRKRVMVAARDWAKHTAQNSRFGELSHILEQMCAIYHKRFVSWNGQGEAEWHLGLLIFGAVLTRTGLSCQSAAQRWSLTKFTTMCYILAEIILLSSVNWLPNELLSGCNTVSHDPIYNVYILKTGWFRCAIYQWHCAPSCLLWQLILPQDVIFITPYYNCNCQESSDCHGDEGKSCWLPLLL